MMVIIDSVQNHDKLEKNVPIRKIPRNSMMPVCQEFMLPCDFNTHISTHKPKTRAMHARKETYLPLHKTECKLSNGILAERIMKDNTLFINLLYVI